MKYFFVLFQIPFYACMMLSCSSSAIEADMDEYCECISSAQNDVEMLKCAEQARDISEKYEFDPEAADYIKKRVQDCAKN
jgi:DNA repair ATPase RecN